MNWIMSVILKHKSDNRKIFSQKQLHFRHICDIIIVTERDWWTDTYKTRN